MGRLHRPAIKVSPCKVNERQLVAGGIVTKQASGVCNYVWDTERQGISTIMAIILFKVFIVYNYPIYNNLYNNCVLQYILCILYAYR